MLNGCKEPYDGQIREYINNHTDVQWDYIQTDQGGVSNARNIALDVAKGEYVAFIDDDDYVSPVYLESLMKVSSSSVIGFAHPIAFNIRGTYPYVIEDQYRKIEKAGAVNYNDVRKIFQGPAMKLFNKDIIGSRRFDISLKNGEDALYMFLLSNKFHQVRATTEDAIYYRRIREDSAAHSKKKKFYYVRNSSRLLIKYSKIYVCNLRQYSFSFFLTRILGAFRMILH